MRGALNVVPSSVSTETIAVPQYHPKGELSIQPTPERTAIPIDGQETELPAPGILVSDSSDHRLVTSQPTLDRLDRLVARL